MSRVVLVTGASAGIGKATCDLLHSRGWDVVGGSRRATGSGAWTAVRMDVDSDDEVSGAVAAVVSEHGRIDAVVACAGWGLAGPVEHTSTSDAKDQFETNFWGAVRTVKEVLPHMRAQGGGGRVVLVGSLGGLIALPFQAFYSASKYAMEGYGEALAYEVAPFGIHVTIVEPGNIRTEFTASRRDVAVLGGDPYEKASEKAIAVMERDEQSGAAPQIVAKVITRVLEDRSPPRRVSAGRQYERLGVVAKRVMPHRLFEKAAASSLGI